MQNRKIPQPPAQDAPPARGIFTCAICFRAGEHALHHAPEFQNGMGTVFPYFECSGCGCLQHVAIPADLGRYYPGHYYSHQPVKGRGLSARIRDALARRGSRHALYGKGLVGALYDLVSPEMNLFKLGRIGINHDTRILDVGSGTAGSLHFLADEGFRHVTGVDPFIHESVRHANGLQVLKREFRSLEGEWDVILFNHSLEHMPDHADTLRKAREVLADDGWCIIEIPTVSSFAWRQYGIYWHQLDAPRHLFLHSLESFRLLAEGAGFEIRETLFTSNTSQFWGSENYRRGVKPKVSRSLVERIAVLFYRLRTCLPQYLKARRLNRRGQGDQVAFYLRKKAPVSLGAAGGSGKA
jgi:SAM-dependent methyltransferase